MTPLSTIGARGAALLRPRRSLVVLAGGAGDESGRALEDALAELGVETTYVGQEEDAGRIAEAAVRARADAIELCLTGRAGDLLLLRQLLHQLIQIGRRDISIVVHRRPGAAKDRGVEASGH